LPARIASNTLGSNNVERIAESAALGDVTQQPAHDLAAAGLRQFRYDVNLPRPRDLSDFLGDLFAQHVDHLIAAVLRVRLEDDEPTDALTGRLIGGWQRLIAKDIDPELHPTPVVETYGIAMLRRASGWLKFWTRCRAAWSR
jgi:hypothetical protein